MCSVLATAMIICLTLLAMLMIKLGEVNRRINNSTGQIVKLLNGMHEGLLILSNAT